MRCSLVFVAMLAACTDPYGEYVAAVYQAADGSLSVKLCAFKSNETASPDECHVEAVGPPPAADAASTTASRGAAWLHAGTLLRP